MSSFLFLSLLESSRGREAELRLQEDAGAFALAAEFLSGLV